MEKLIMHTDGGARGNPGPAGIGVVITDEKGKVVHTISEYIGETTNNVAEYEALIRGLVALQKMYGPQLREMKLEVQMDSELVVRQLSGLYKVKDEGMKRQFGRVAQIRLEDAPNIIFTHVRREKNAHADELVNQALDAQLKK